MSSRFLYLAVKIGLLVLCIHVNGSPTSYETPRGFSSPLTSNAAEPEGEIWALLVAGSNGWFNYRHQADVCHAYHVLVNHGVKAENIITMMYDDIAHNPLNPYKPKIFNAPNSSDVYAGVKIDYRKEAVNPENFLAILQGNASQVKGGNGRTLKTCKKDKVFVYFADHGAPGSIAFPDDVLTVKSLNEALKQMHKEEKYSELVFYLEACESGSMFEGQLKAEQKVYALTAANSKESSWGTYCGTSTKLSTCLGDLFSVNWLQDSDRENLHIETLFKQFEIVRNKTNESHVMKYGDLAITKEPVADFQGASDAKPQPTVDNVGHYENWPSREIPLKSLQARMMYMNDATEQQKIAIQLAEMRMKRQYLDKFMQMLVRKLIHDPNIRAAMLTKVPGEITALDCHHDVVHAFNRICFQLGSSSYATAYVKVLANLCEYGLSTQKIVNELMDRCIDVEHRNIV